MALLGSIAALRGQAPQTSRFAVAFSHAAELLRPGSEANLRLRGMAAGETKKIDLAEGVFALEQVYQTKPRAEGRFETHRKNIDLQVVIEGDEVMEVIDSSHLSLTQDYDPERDLIFYGDSDRASRFRLTPGTAAFYFPADAHMGSLRTGAAPVLVRKVVLKIPVG